MRTKQIVSILVVTISLYISCVSADLYTNLTKDEIEKGFDEATGGLEIIDMLTIGTLMKVCWWGMAISLLVGLFGYFRNKPELFNYGAIGVIVCIGCILIFGVGSNLLDYSLDYIFG